MPSLKNSLLPPGFPFSYCSFVPSMLGQLCCSASLEPCKETFQVWWASPIFQLDTSNLTTGEHALLPGQTEPCLIYSTQSLRAETKAVRVLAGSGFLAPDSPRISPSAPKMWSAQSKGCLKDEWMHLNRNQLSYPIINSLQVNIIRKLSYVLPYAFMHWRLYAKYPVTTNSTVHVLREGQVFA